MDAGLRLGRIENEFSLAALLLHRVVAGNRHLSERLVIRSDAVAENEKVQHVCQRRRRKHRRRPDNDQSFEEILDAVSCC